MDRIWLGHTMDNHRYVLQARMIAHYYENIPTKYREQALDLMVETLKRFDDWHEGGFWANRVFDRFVEETEGWV